MKRNPKKPSKSKTKWLRCRLSLHFAPRW